MVSLFLFLFIVLFIWRWQFEAVKEENSALSILILIRYYLFLSQRMISYQQQQIEFRFCWLKQLLLLLLLYMCHRCSNSSHHWSQKSIAILLTMPDIVKSANTRGSHHQKKPKTPKTLVRGRVVWVFTFRSPTNWNKIPRIWLMDVEVSFSAAQTVDSPILCFFCSVRAI